MSKVLIISTSLRGNSNSEHLAHECEKGALDAGNEVAFLSLKGKSIGYCIGCLACQRTGKCVLRDDAAEFCEKVKNADVLVFATPIYYYAMCGQMKTLLDRLNPLSTSDYRVRKVCMIATAAEDSDSAFEKAYNGLLGWVDCFEKAELCGLVACGGIGDSGDAKNHADAVGRAYGLGRSL